MRGVGGDGAKKGESNTRKKNTEKSRYILATKQ